jgi:hypothetical protein
VDLVGDELDGYRITSPRPENLSLETRRAPRVYPEDAGIADRRSEMGESNHEGELNRLLAELGETLGRRERLLEGMKRTRTQARLHEITVEADQPFEGWDQDMLVEDLQREIEHQHAQERELQRVVDLLERQRGIEDRLFEELDTHLDRQHRDDLAELWRLMERRDEIFESMESGSLEEKRKLIPESIERQREIEDRLFRLIERHLARRHRA